jgi:hypothetical protein
MIKRSLSSREPRLAKVATRHDSQGPQIESIGKVGSDDVRSDFAPLVTLGVSIATVQSSMKFETVGFVLPNRGRQPNCKPHDIGGLLARWLVAGLQKGYPTSNGEVPSRSNWQVHTVSGVAASEEKNG